MRVVVFDMDGVLWALDDPIAGAAEAVARCRAGGCAVYFLTNNSSRTRADYVAKLARFDIPATVDEVVTSAHATAAILAAEKPGAAVVMIGEDGLRAELEDAGLRVVPYREGDRVDYVVVGWDRGLSYDKLAQAHGAIVRGGAEFVATNRDVTYPGPGGRTMPGGGSIVAAVAASTGVEPRTIGKPEPHTLEWILQDAGAQPQECLVVGDRLDTDIALAKRVGTPAALVLTGVSTRDEALAAPPEQRPDFILSTLDELV